MEDDGRGLRHVLSLLHSLVTFILLYTHPPTGMTLLPAKGSSMYSSSVVVSFSIIYKGRGVWGSALATKHFIVLHLLCIFLLLSVLDSTH